MNYHILLFTALLIAASHRHPPTCSDVALLGHWDTGLCCEECHSQAATEGPERALIHDGFQGRPALLCCHASLMIHGYQGMPCHSEEVAS